jgi:hypothetical protein
MTRISPALSSRSLLEKAFAADRSKSNPSASITIRWRENAIFRYSAETVGR